MSFVDGLQQINQVGRLNQTQLAKSAEKFVKEAITDISTITMYQKTMLKKKKKKVWQ